MLLASRTSANAGILYGPEDAVVFGAEDKMDPRPLGYCVPWSILASTHLGFGFAFGRSNGGGTSHLLDLTMGMRCGRSLGGNPRQGGLIVVPNGGYTFEERDARPDLHLGRFGLGIGFGQSIAAIAYVPRILLGGNDGTRARGIRHGLVFYLGADMVTIELSQQILWVDGRSERDVRGVASVNLLVLAYALAR